MDIMLTLNVSLKNNISRAILLCDVVSFKNDFKNNFENNFYRWNNITLKMFLKINASHLHIIHL